MSAQIGKGALHNRVALITGGGSGIGRGIALAFAREGATVAISGRRTQQLDDTVAEISAAGGKALAIQADVADAAACRRIITECITQLGKLHILVNNAGIARFASLEQTSDADIDAMLDINLRAVMLLTKYAAQELAKHKLSGGASVLNIGTSAAHSPLKNFSVYSSAKAALDQFTRCIALELGEHRVRVNCIHPGVVETPIFETMMPKDAIKTAMSNFAAQTPLGRVGLPQDIAEAALFFCSDRASWITGASLTVDGGISLT